MSVYAFDLSILKYVHSVVYGEVAVGKAAVKLSAAMGDHPGVRISLSLSLSAITFQYCSCLCRPEGTVK